MNCCNNFGQCERGHGCPAGPAPTYKAPLQLDGPYYSRRRHAMHQAIKFIRTAFTRLLTIQSPKHMESIVSISRIQREATAAASRSSDISAACLYPIGSTAAIKFEEFFNLAKAKVIANNGSTE